jgi:WD40 repeat protein
MNAIPDADLLEAYLGDGLTATEVATLEERLRSEPDLAEALVILAREEAVLSEWARAARMAEATAGQQAVDRPRESAAVIARGGFWSWPGRYAFPPRAAAALVAAAAVVLLAVLGVTLVQNWKGGEPPFLANLEEVQGEVLIVTPAGLTFPAKPGQKLFADQELRTGGEDSFAVVKYKDKTRLELSPETLIRLLGEAPPGARNKAGRGKKVFLNEGVLALEVVAQPEGDPMVLTTPHAVMEVRESMFSSASTRDATRIELDGGRIQFTRKSDGKSIEVGSGYYAVAAAPAELFVPHVLPARVKKPRAILKQVRAPVLSLAYAPDGKTLAIGSKDGSIRLCDPETGAERAVLAKHKKVSSLVFAGSGKTLAGVVDDRAVKLWDAATLQEQRSFQRRKLKITCLALSPDNKTLATGCGDKSVRLWDADTGQERGALHVDGGDVLSLAFSPDGKTLAGGTGRGQEWGQVILWSLPDRQKQASLVGHRGPVRALAYASDGQILASGSDDGTVRLWDPKTGQARGMLGGHVRKVVSVALSPDGLRLASAGNDNTARLWDLANGSEEAIFRPRKHRACCVAFSPDGKILATGGWDKTVRLWNAIAKEMDEE